MLTPLTKLRRTAFVFVAGASLVLPSFGIATTSASTAPTARQTGGASVPGLLVANDQTWAPEALEDLLAPIALYPDEVIGHILVATTNPQEVLDAGNWRTKNQNLDTTALDAAAKRAGFTAPARMLIQNPRVLDMMCSEFGWTEELGQAFLNDQVGVLDAVQRLRQQAKSVGNLNSSDKMLVDTVNQGGREAILVTSPDHNIVNVPQYDVDKVYTTALDDDDNHDGVSMGTTVLTGVLGFVGGLAIGKLFDDDDDDDWDDDDYYYPNYYGPPMPYYAHTAYRPVYPGYYPATVYAPPPAYPYAYNAYPYGPNNTTVVHREVNNYWNRYDDRTYVRRNNRAVVSPITKARPNRPELVTLNERARRGPERRAPDPTVERRSYGTRKLETAARAERRRAAETERRAARIDQLSTPTGGKAGRSTIPPLDKPGADRAGTGPGRRNAARVRGDDGASGTGRTKGTRSGSGYRARPNAGEAGADPAVPRTGGKNRAARSTGGTRVNRPLPEAGAGNGEATTPGTGADRTAPRAGGRNRAARTAGGDRPPPTVGGDGATQGAGADRAASRAGRDTRSTSKTGGGRNRAGQNSGDGASQRVDRGVNTPKAGGRRGGRRQNATQGGSTEPANPTSPD
jgi:hypothetical protein